MHVATLQSCNHAISPLCQKMCPHADLPAEEALRYPVEVHLLECYPGLQGQLLSGSCHASLAMTLRFCVNLSDRTRAGYLTAEGAVLDLTLYGHFCLLQVAF